MGELAGRKLLTVLIAPNEDGFGPSSLAYHLIRAFLACARDFEREIRVVIRTGTKVRYNSDLHRGILSGVSEDGLVSIEPVNNLIQLKKTVDGGLDTISSLDGLLQYPALQHAYINQPLPAVDVAVDIGVPALARACANRGVPCFTVFDHSWGFTFRRILLDQHASVLSAVSASELRTAHHDIEPSEAIRMALNLLETDESASRRVFLFDSPLTSQLYWAHWGRLTPNVEAVGGSLGGPIDETERKLWRESAQKILELQPDDNSTAVLVSAGGTPVWDEVLPRFVEQCAQADVHGQLRYHVFVFASDPVRKRISERGISLTPTHRTLHLQGEYEQRKNTAERWVEQWVPAGCTKVRILGNAVNCTYQAVIAGVDLLVSRAGGATVNDSIACGVPMLLVPEPGHWQVQAIHTAVLDDGYGLPLPHDEFVRDPKGALDARVQPFKPLWDHIRAQMSSSRRACEISVAQRILHETGLAYV